MAEHPITPPEATVLSLRNSAPHGIGDFGATRELWLINHAYAAGADQELEACCEWLPKSPAWIADDLRRHRRPKPPSLKALALEALEVEDDSMPLRSLKRAERFALIRRALEALPE